MKEGILARASKKVGDFHIPARSGGWNGCSIWKYRSGNQLEYKVWNEMESRARTHHLPAESLSVCLLGIKPTLARAHLPGHSTPENQECGFFSFLAFLKHFYVEHSCCAGHPFEVCVPFSAVRGLYHHQRNYVASHSSPAFLSVWHTLWSCLF